MSLSGSILGSVFNVQCAVRNIKFKCLVSIVQITFRGLMCEECTLQFSVCIVKYALCKLKFTLQNVECSRAHAA